MWHGLTLIFQMKVSNLLIERIALGLTLLTVVGCSDEQIKPDQQNLSDTLKSSVESNHDTLMDCDVPENKLKRDSLSIDSLLENGIPKITRDCPTCGMG